MDRIPLLQNGQKTTPSVMTKQMRAGSVLLSVVFLTALTIGACQKNDDLTAKSNPAASEKSRQVDRKGKNPVTIKRPILKIHWADVYANYVVTINGFPARERWVKGRAVDNVFDVPIQTGLVRGKNEVAVRLRPRLRHRSRELTISRIEFTTELLPYRDALDAVAVIGQAQVDSAYARWSRRAREEWERVLANSSPEAALDSIKIWAGSRPLVVRETFDNEAGPDFSRIFEEAPVLEDTPSTRKRLKGYAVRLRDLMAEKDTAALFEEFRPAIEDRFREVSFHSREVFMQRNREALVLEDAMLDFGREDVALRKWVGGRVWQLVLTKAENDGFFQTPSGSGRGKIYVGKIDGELKVVRQG